MVKAVLFDFDGTVADTSEGVIGSARKAIEILGLDLNRTDEELRGFLGPPLRVSYYRCYGLEGPIVDEAVNLFRKDYTATGYQFLKIYPGMRETFVKLRKKGYKLGVASYKIQGQLDKCSRIIGITDLVDTIRGADEEGTLSKADIIALAAKDLGCECSEVLMVGDTDNDKIGADGAGALFAGVTYGFGYDKDTRIEGVRMFDSPEEIAFQVESF